MRISQRVSPLSNSFLGRSVSGFLEHFWSLIRGHKEPQGNKEIKKGRVDMIKMIEMDEMEIPFDNEFMARPTYIKS